MTSTMSPDRRDKLREMSRVNVAAAIVLGEEAGFTQENVVASLFGVIIGMLHSQYRLSPATIHDCVTDALTPPEKKQ